MSAIATENTIVVSMVKDCTTTETGDVSVAKLLDAIKSGRYRKQIEEIRSAFHSSNRDRKAIDALKKQLPAFR